MEGGETSSNKEGKWRDRQEYQRSRGKVGSLAAKRKTDRDIGRSTKEVKERWCDNQTESLITQGLTLSKVSKGS